MQTRNLLVIIVLAVVAGFLALNWGVFSATAKFNFLAASVEMPIGLVMFALLALVTVTFGIYSAVSWSSLLLEFRRQSKELAAQRALADQAEESRFTELRSLMHEELARLSEHIAELHTAMRTDIHDNANSVAATIGELDDRMQKLYGRAGQPLE